MSSDPTASPLPPAARREPTQITLHGTTLSDEFRWLRERDSPEVREYLEAENAYTAAVMAPTEPLQKTLYAEMLSHIKETDESVPYRFGDWFYLTRTVEGSQYPIHSRRRARGAVSLPSLPEPSDTEHVILDVNQLAAGKPFMSLGALSVSPDGTLLAYTTDATGYRQYTLHLRDLTSGTDLADTAERVGSVAWAADSRTMFYTTEDETTKRPDRVLRHVVGRPTSEDTLVFHEEDERFNVGVGKTRDGQYVMVESGSHTTNEYRFVPAATPDAHFTLVAPRVDEQEYYPDHRSAIPGEPGLFFIRTNDAGKNFRVVTAPVANPAREHWTELIPLDPNHPLEDLDLFQTFAVATWRKLGLPTLEVLRFTAEAAPSFAPAVPITFPEPTYTASVHVNRVFSTSVFRYSYTSLVSPPSVYEYNVSAEDYPVGIGESQILKRQEVPGGFSPDRYASERIWIDAPRGLDQDGAAAPGTIRIPVSIVYRCDRFGGNATNPLYLYGYGSYGYPLPVGFSPSRLSLLDRGIVMAYAHIRGGGELGDAWHDDGKMQAKQNTFTDFIAAARQLPEKGFGSVKRIAIEGGSAGGLLMGAVVNLAAAQGEPDLFRAVLSHVPFVDVMNTMLDATLPLTVAEYEEWGNPNEPEAFRTMLAYSPYDNVRPGAYPAMLVKTSLNDSQVMYWEPAKYVARLRLLKSNPETPLLLHTNMDAGHGGASGRYDYLKEIAFDYAFLLTQLGVEGV
ncbi:MAG: S9 family peptidase [Acidobacteriota bacterium]|nr:S9 family peptidase [Acidobacteriota bacterium]